ncbi:MAG: hypothetical protein ABEJ70_03940 [Halobacteriaceae archaeon]
MLRRRFLRALPGSMPVLGGCATASDPVTDDATSASPTSDPTTAPTTDRSVQATSASQTSTDTSTTRERTTDGDARETAADEALVVESVAPVSGTNVNVGARGVATNTAGRWLVDCELAVSGEVGGQTFETRATRSPLAPHGRWEWTVPFGRRADALDDDSPEGIAVETSAAFMEWG